MALRTCPECGRQISDKATVCIHCGCPIAKVCPECGAAADEADSVCKTCGFPFENTAEVPNVTGNNALVPRQTGALLTGKTAVELINYIQFSVAKIINGKSKGLLEDEFDAVINNINPASLQAPELINAYDTLLSTLTALRLNENQREQAAKVLERKKKNAVTNCLNSFGSIFVPGVNPVSLLASVAYTGVSAALNYRRAVNEVKIEGEERFFEIDQNDLEYIDTLRANLFIATAKVFANRSNSAEGLISENTMKQFADAVNSMYDGEESARNALLYLDAAEHDLSLFPPYWLARAVANYKSGSEKSDYVQYLDKFNELNANNPIFKKNPYCVEASKLRIEASNVMLNSDGIDDDLRGRCIDTIKNAIEVIKDNTQAVQSDLDSMNFDFVQLYEQIGDFDNANKCIAYLEGRQLIPKTSRMKLQCRLLQNKVSDVKTVALMEKAFCTVEFDFNKYSGVLNLENKTDEELANDSPNVKFHISENAVHGLDVKSVRFSPNGSSDGGVEAVLTKYKSIYECTNVTWNMLVQNPFIEIDFGTFKAFYKASIAAPDDWEYVETVNNLGSLSKITAPMDLLDSAEVVSNFTTYNVKDGLKLGAKFGAGALLGGVIGVGIATAVAAKDIKRAWKSKNKAALTWLTISLIAVKEASGEKKMAIDEKGQVLIPDLRD